MRSIAIRDLEECDALISLVESELEYRRSVCQDTAMLDRMKDKLEHAQMLLEKDTGWEGGER